MWQWTMCDKIMAFILLLESEEAEPPAKRTYLVELLSKEDMLIQDPGKTAAQSTWLRTGVLSDDTKGMWSTRILDKKKRAVSSPF